MGPINRAPAGRLSLLALDCGQRGRCICDVTLRKDGLESDVSPLAAEYRLKLDCSTQNKAKRANKIVCLLLFRDQEVEGSNPFAPTTSSRISDLLHTKNPQSALLES